MYVEQGDGKKHRFMHDWRFLSSEALNQFTTAKRR